MATRYLRRAILLCSALAVSCQRPPTIDRFRLDLRIPSKSLLANELMFFSGSEPVPDVRLIRGGSYPNFLPFLEAGLSIKRKKSPPLKRMDDDSWEADLDLHLKILLPRGWKDVLLFDKIRFRESDIWEKNLVISHVIHENRVVRADGLSDLIIRKILPQETNLHYDNRANMTVSLQIGEVKRWLPANAASRIWIPCPDGGGKADVRINGMVTGEFPPLPDQASGNFDSIGHMAENMFFLDATGNRCYSIYTIQYGIYDPQKDLNWRLARKYLHVLPMNLAYFLENPPEMSQEGYRCYAIREESCKGKN